MDKTKIRAKGMVQKDILYCPEIDFIVFDIFVEDRWLNWDDIIGLCSEVGFKTVPVLYRGSYSNAIKFDSNKLLTEVPSMYDLPVIKGNIMEGVVVRPTKEPESSLAVEWPHDHGVRQMYKIRTENYNEKKYIKIPKFKNGNPEFLAQLANVQSYVTKNRFNAVKSKELPITSMKEIPKYIQLMIEDIQKDAEKDGVKVEVEVYRALKRDIAILVRKEIEATMKHS